MVSYDRVRLKDELGQGAFGRVYKAVLQVGHSYMTVAVKTYVGQTADKTKRASFLQVPFYSISKVFNNYN